MRVCVVGNGPTAAGKGREIDACDFVVRLKAFWAYAALNAGSKIDALAWFGAWHGWRQLEKELPRECEFWYTHCPEQIETMDDAGYRRLEFFCRRADYRVVRHLTNCDWMLMREYLDRHPSTGFVAIHMALRILPVSKLVLVGFDSLEVQDPNYCSARRPFEEIVKYGFDPDNPPHNTRREKEAIAELVIERRWCGQSVNIKAEWMSPPLPLQALTTNRQGCDA